MQPIMEISTAGLRRNWQRIRGLVRSETKIAAVIKCDAYGLGCRRVAEVLLDEGCSWFFVGTLEEALVIRHHALDARISVLNPDHGEDTQHYEALNVEPVVSSWIVLKHFIGARYRGNAMLNIDTGLGRSSIRYSEMPELQECLTDVGFSISGVMSHLANAATLSHPQNIVQKQRFDDILSKMRPPLASLSASAGLLLGDSFLYDFVRVGAFILGDAFLRDRMNLTEPLITVTASVSDVFTLQPGDNIGYGTGDGASQARRIAIVNIGYRHGYPALLKMGTKAYCAGHIVSIVGNPSMEQLSIDVSRVPEKIVVPGTRVELINATFDVYELAGQAERSGLELMLQLGYLLQRSYL